jgi:hypothetical protein
MWDSTTSRHIQDMSQDTEPQVIANIKVGDFFAIYFNESTDIIRKAQLLAFSKFFVMETSLNNFYFASHFQKQQKAKTLLMLSTVISVLEICHGNRASATARMALPLCREACKDLSHWPRKRTPELFLHTLSCIERSSFQNQQYLRSRRHWMRRPRRLTLSRAGY